MILVFGLPAKVRIRILGVMLSADKRLFKLSLLSTIPTPPTEALELFKVAEEVRSVYSEDSCWYFIGCM